MTLQELQTFVDTLSDQDRLTLSALLRSSARGVTQHMRDLCTSGELVKAINEWRLATGLGLREAVETFRAEGLMAPAEVDATAVR